MRPHGSRDRAPIPSEPDPARGSPALGAGGVWVAAAAAAAGVGSAYWDDSWHTTLGRDSTFIPPHLLLYASILTVGVVIAGWGWRRLAATRSVAAVFRTPGFALAVAAAVATAAARNVRRLMGRGSDMSRAYRREPCLQSAKTKRRSPAGRASLPVGMEIQGGSPSRTRTCDKSVNSRLLYQLSYRGSRWRRRYTQHGPGVQALKSTLSTEQKKSPAGAGLETKFGDGGVSSRKTPSWSRFDG